MSCQRCLPDKVQFSWFGASRPEDLSLPPSPASVVYASPRDRALSEPGSPSNAGRLMERQGLAAPRPECAAAPGRWNFPRPVSFAHVNQGADMADQPNLAPEILLVEDEPLIAMYIEDSLVRSGFTVSGPFETVVSGSDAARRFNGAAALVDLLLDGDDATIVTEILASRNIPFVVMTGRDAVDASPAARSAPMLKKPFLIGDLLGAIRDVCADRVG